MKSFTCASDCSDVARHRSTASRIQYSIFTCEKGVCGQYAIAGIGVSIDAQSAVAPSLVACILWYGERLTIGGHAAAIAASDVVPLQVCNAINACQ